MNAATAIARLEKSGLRLITTSEAAAIWQMNGKAAAELLRRLARTGIVERVRRGLWMAGRVDPFLAVERAAEPDAAYVSLLTALRFRGMIEQITPSIQVVTTGRARRLRTPLGIFSFHHLDPRLFGGFERVRGIPLATAEKALVDTLYLASSRTRSFARLPEIELPRDFSRAAASRWVTKIPSPRLRASVHRRLQEILRKAR